MCSYKKSKNQRIKFKKRLPQLQEGKKIQQVVEKIVFHRLVKNIQLQGTRNHEE
jgi:hypothetical protein